MNYTEIIRSIESDQDLPGRIERFEQFQVLLRQYHLDRDCKTPKNTIVIAGTNGKGSVAKTIETLLSSRHQGVALFTSPHIIDATERLRSFGKDITRDEFCTVYELILPYKQRMQLGRFETFAIMAYEFFFGGRVRPAVSHAVIEIGVGGRLDPANAFPHDISVITSIGKDHEAILGATLGEIAREKFGIVRPDQLLIYGQLPIEAERALNAAKALPGVRAHQARICPFTVDRSNQEPAWIIETPWGKSRLSLFGKRAVENASIALEVLSRMGEPVNALLPALSNVEWPCRMERFNLDGKVIYLSGDHNADGARSLVELLSNFTYDRVRLVVGVGTNKPVQEMIEIFSNVPRSEIILTTTPFRGAPLDTLRPYSNQVAQIEADPIEALKTACDRAAPSDLVVVTGSLYLAGHVRAWLMKAMT